LLEAAASTVANHDEYDIDRVGQEEKQKLLCLSLNDAEYVFNFLRAWIKNVGDSAKMTEIRPPGLTLAPVLG